MTLPDAGTVTDHGTVPPSWGRSIDDLIEYVGPLGVWAAGVFTPEPGAPAPATGMAVTLLTVDEAALLPDGLDEDVSYYLSVAGGLHLFADATLTQPLVIPPDAPAIEVHYTWLDQWEAVQQFRRTQAPPQVLPPSVYIDSTPLGLAVGAIAQAFDYTLQYVSDPVPCGPRIGDHDPVTIEFTNSFDVIAHGFNLGLEGDASPGAIFANAIRSLGIQQGLEVANAATEPETPAIAGPQALGISWVEADLWNTEAIADGNGPGGLAHATLGVEDLYIPIADDGDWISALLLNDATPSDSLDTRSRYLGVAGASPQI